MIAKKLIQAVLAAVLIVALPTAVAAQEEAAGPEGVRWDLITYISEGEPVSVPFAVDATLMLDSGDASGLAGCNSFGGSYQIEGESLTFDGELRRTLLVCEPVAQSVEDAYLEALPLVSSWAIIDGTLQLLDAADAPILGFAQPTIGLTASDLADLVATLDGLQSQIDTLRKEARRQNVGRLRDRIAGLEAQVKRLRSQVVRQRPAPTAKPVAFSAAERVLLEGIPPRIASRCEPRRSSLPPGTVAAVQCAPNTVLVRDMAYYLLGANDAQSVFAQRMNDNGVPDRGGAASCTDGSPVATYWVGSGPSAEGCYRDGNGRASLRFLEFATDCSVLRVGGKRLPIPTIYIAVLGNDGDIAKLAGWATRGSGEAEASNLTRLIIRPKAAISPACPV